MCSNGKRNDTSVRFSFLPLWEQLSPVSTEDGRNFEKFKTTFRAVRADMRSRGPLDTDRSLRQTSNPKRDINRVAHRHVTEINIPRDHGRRWRRRGDVSWLMCPWSFRYMAGNVLTADFGVLLSTHERAAGGVDVLCARLAVNRHGRERLLLGF